MLEYILPAFTVFGLVLVAAVSPGPDFLIVVRNALGRGRRSGIFTAWGIASAIFVHVAYCMMGIGLLIAQSVVLFNVVKWLGALYLVYMGVMALRSKGWNINDLPADDQSKAKEGRAAFVNGFVTNVFNPKATLFFLALFTQVIDPQTVYYAQFGYGVICALTAGTWFTCVSFFLTQTRIRAFFTGASIWIDRITGGAFIALAAKLAMSKAAESSSG